MRFAIQHGIGDPGWSPAILEPAAVRRFAQTAEGTGWDAIAFTDHPAPSEAWVGNGGEGVADWAAALAFCAAVTDHIRLLTAVIVPAYRNPFLAAHQLATIDALSAGRLIVGLGTGYLFSEMQALGGDPSRRLALFDESIDIMLRAWTGAPVAVEAEGYRARGAIVHPPVVQRPHPPLWVHGNSRWGTERAVSIGQGWIGMLTGDDDVLVRTVRTAPIRDIDALARRLDGVRAACTAHGRDPEDLEIVVTGPWSYLDVRTGWSSEQALDDVGRMVDLGVGWVLATCVGDDPEASVETVARFADDIIARTRS